MDEPREIAARGSPVVRTPEHAASNVTINAGTGVQDHAEAQPLARARAEASSHDEHRSATPLPIRSSPRLPTPFDQDHDVGTSASTSQSGRSHRFRPHRRRGLEPQSVAFARSQQDREAALDRSRRHQPTPERRRSHSPSSHQLRRLDHDRYRDRHQSNDDLDYHAQGRSSHDANTHGTHRTVPGHGRLHLLIEQEDRSVRVRVRRPIDDRSTYHSGPLSPPRRAGRSRSPVKTPTEHYRHSANHQGSSSVEHSAGGRPVEDAEDADHQKVLGVIETVAQDSQLRGPGFAARFKTTLQMPEIQDRKNMHSICIPCLLEDLRCDHQSICGQCKTRGTICAYIICPLVVCELDIKCPAVHIYPGLLMPDHKLGTCMHLIALLGLNLPSMQSYDTRQIQAIHDNTTSAQYIYVLIEDRIQRTAQQTKNFNDNVAQKLLRKSDKVPNMNNRALSTIASMIAKLVEQQRKQAYRELWEHYRRQLESGPVDRN